MFCFYAEFKSLPFISRIFQHVGITGNQYAVTECGYGKSPISEEKEVTLLPPAYIVNLVKVIFPFIPVLFVNSRMKCEK